MLNNVLDTMEIKEFKMNSLVIKAGSSSPKEMVIVLKGNVGVYKFYGGPREEFVKTIGPGSFHCENSLFLNYEQTETIIALTDAVILFISRRNIGDFFKKHTDMAISIVESLCERLAKNSAELRKLQSENQPDAPSGQSALFPEGHGSYTLELSNDDEQLVYCVKTTCPLCNFNFERLGIMNSRLVRSGTDPDMRVRYTDVEPLYYDIVTCPCCLFSASNKTFGEVPRKFASAVAQKVGPYILKTQIQSARDRDTFTVFAGYYLAVICAAVVFPEYQLILGNLWHKISRLYSDCKKDDSNAEKLEKYALEQSLQNYQYAYSNFRIPEKDSVQVSNVMGEIYLKLGNLEEAKKSFYAVKTHIAATDVLKRRAEVRIDEIRETEKQMLETAVPVK